MTASATLLLVALQGDAAHYIELGRAALQENRLPDAEAYFRRAVDSDRSLSDAHYFLGLTLLRQGQPKDAATALERARDLSARPNPSILFELGKAYARLERPVEAERALVQAATLAPERDLVHLELGWLHYKRLEGEKAEAEFREALKRKESGAARFYLGLAETALGKLDAAARSFRRALVLEPANVEAAVALGKTLVRLHREAEAEAVLNGAISLDPRSAEANYQLGLLALGRGQLAAARDGFERAAASDPGHHGACYNLVLVYERLGEKVEAEKARARFESLAAGKEK